MVMNEKLTPVRKTLTNKITESKFGKIAYLTPVITKTVDNDMSEMSLKVASVEYKMETLQCSTNIKESQIKEAMSMHNIDMASMCKNVLYNEDLMTIDKKILKLYSDLGEQSALSLLTKWQKFVSKYFKSLKFTYYVDSRTIAQLIAKLSNVIAQKTRRGPATFIIVSNSVNAILQDCSYFIHSDSNNGLLNTNSTVYVSGTFLNMIIIVDRYKSNTDHSIVIGRTTAYDEPGLHLVENIPEIESIQTPRDESIVRLVHNIALVQTIGAGNSYLKVNLNFNKKPLWRKLMKL